MSPEQSTGRPAESPDGTLLDRTVDELSQARDSGLLWLVLLALSGVLAISVVAMAVLSWAVYTTGDLAGLVSLVTVNAAWLYTSLFALVGLFVPFARVGPATHSDDLVGLLAGHWAIVAVGVLPGLAVAGVVGLLAFEPFSIAGFLGFAILTILVLAAFVSIGIAIRLVAASDGRALAALLSVYFILVFLWDTTIVPIIVAMPAVGDPARTLGDPPAWFDWLVALSPGRAFATAAEGTHAGVGGLELFGLVVLVAWILVPPALARAIRS